ncbi:MAG: hypothetical protein KDD89_05650, partial [Anaerolineales bacterium]|nr:hypothetical protein [Anaerolineales bacterium]
MSEQEIKRLKEEEAEQAENTAQTRPPRSKHHKHHKRHERPNLFGPILLIGIGLYFLLTNMGIIQGTLYWEVLFSWWPLFFIFIGFNIIAKQLP